ncbi:phage tail tape measure protein [Acinetobacter seifertii]|uniref:phage tail tape measure protein n=1 Tax=Acinetobacter seifertii TaxID=1530123 RepID=UPI0029417EF5|nr:phage tail tape measure protein [Acinetobacter seifertii]MDV4263311.1 phage tail tape measure protein [Acinetobacter seifertii]
MSTRNTTVSLTLQIKGSQAGQELKRISDQQITAANKVNQQWTQIGSAQAKLVNTARVGTRETLNTARAGEQLLRTNRMLEGVLRQQSIQTKLQAQTYKQSVNSISQMASLVRQIEQSSKRTHEYTQNTSSLWQKGTAIAGGAAASGMYISNALQKPRDYDQQLTYIAATATGGQGMSTAARLAARGQLNEYIKSAIRNGGGTREDAAEAANTLIASGKYDLKNVKPALNASVKTAFATGASANDSAILTTRMQDFGITNLQEGHDIAVRGGQLGAFEYKDQAKWLAQQMAAARAIGYSGKQGFIQLVGMNQVSMSTAATRDEAGNNLVNLLTKLSSREFSKSIGDEVKIQKGDPTRMSGKKKPHPVFDWSTYAIQQREQGVYGVQAFMKLLERQFAGNKQYQALQSKALNASNSADRKQALEDMINIAGGSEIGKIIADRQALMAAYAVSYQNDNLNKIMGQLQGSAGTVNTDYQMVSQTEWAKDIALNQEKLFAQSKMYDQLSTSLGDAKEKITDWAAGNENLAATTYGASVAVGALALGAGAAALALNSLGGLRSRVAPEEVVRRGTGTPPRPQPSARVGIGGAAGLVGAAYVGSQIIKPYDDAGYSIVSKFLSKIGIGSGDSKSPDFVQQAIEQSKAQQASAEVKTTQLITEQQKQNALSQELINQVKNLIHVTGQNKPIASGNTLLDSISQNAQKQEQRYGAPRPPFKIGN